jgi:anti-sigma B factor antagonist
MNQEMRTGSKVAPSARQEGDAALVAITGEVDLNNSPELRTVLLKVLSQWSPKKLILNLALVPYMDSSAIAVLVELLRKMKGGKVLLTDLQPRVKGLLEIARLNTIFGIVATEQEALSK